MDFFYVWLRRTLQRLSGELKKALAAPLSPKWNHSTNDGELIDDSCRYWGDIAKSKVVYEDGMFRAFTVCCNVLNPEGFLVVVFANKQPEAWERLASSLIRAGFVVESSWPIETEMRGGVGNFGRASLASSVWLVCRKRPETARPGWEDQVLEEMRSRIGARLNQFWDAGIRGPDGALAPGYAGIRPKISGPKAPAADFLLQGPAGHGIRGLVNLFGIESPGLTASLALADDVAKLVQE